MDYKSAKSRQNIRKKNTEWLQETPLLLTVFFLNTTSKVKSEQAVL